MAHTGNVPLGHSADYAYIVTSSLLLCIPQSLHHVWVPILADLGPEVQEVCAAASLACCERALTATAKSMGLGTKRFRLLLMGTTIPSKTEGSRTTFWWAWVSNPVVLTKFRFW